MTSAPEPLLLDTHVWVWINEGVAELSDDLVREIDRASSEGGVFVSVFSVWEVALLCAKGRLTLGLALPEWVQQALAPPVTLAGLTPAIALESHQLPDRFQSDPADRILVATARCERLTLVTRDRAILAYAARGHVKALAC